MFRASKTMACKADCVAKVGVPFLFRQEHGLAVLAISQNGKDDQFVTKGA